MSFGTIGQPLNRVDGRAKVTGTATYAAEHQIDNLAHGVLAQSAISRGRIKSLDTSRAQAAPGVLAVFTYQNMPRLTLPDPNGAGGSKPGELFAPLQTDAIHYNGQHIALVIADTLEHAQHAADLIEVAYEAQKPVVEIEQGMGRAYKPEKFFGFEDLQVRRNNPTEGLAQSAAQIQQTYTTPIEHHNPMEPHATIAVWNGDNLTLYDSTQGVVATRVICAQALGISPENAQVISPFVGGGFGCKGLMWWHPILAAAAARKVGRPVKIALTRQQMFTSNGYRARTVQQITLGADQNGMLTAIRHHTVTHTSDVDEFCEPPGLTTKMLYAVPNLEVSHTLAKLNRGTPTPMRAPGESPGTFALECALDELAEVLQIDPVQFRIRNHADKHPQTGQPWSSKYLIACYRLGMDKFGWNRRNPVPGSMKTPDGWLVGMGMATATYPALRAPASASAALFADGRAVVSSATQDIGTGTYTVMAQVAADALGLPVERVQFVLGDSRLPPSPVSGGSQTVASVAPAVQRASRALIDKLIALAALDSTSPLYGRSPGEIQAIDGKLVVRGASDKSVAFEDVVRKSGQDSVTVVVNAPTAMSEMQGKQTENKGKPDARQTDKRSAKPDGKPNATAGQPAAEAGNAANKPKIPTGGDVPDALTVSADPEFNANMAKYAFHSFGAQFVEVHINPKSGEIRIARVVNVFDVGKILNAKTANSQIMGGTIMGIGMALLEETVTDTRSGRILNHDLAEYHVPVNADIPPIETYFLDIPDAHIGGPGSRGVGEIGITGVAAAVANAVYHATGKRVRDLPITLDKII